MRGLLHAGYAMARQVRLGRSHRAILCSHLVLNLLHIFQGYWLRVRRHLEYGKSTALPLPYSRCRLKSTPGEIREHLADGLGAIPGEVLGYSQYVIIYGECRTHSCILPPVGPDVKSSAHHDANFVCHIILPPHAQNPPARAWYGWKRTGAATVDESAGCGTA